MTIRLQSTTAPAMSPEYLDQTTTTIYAGRSARAFRFSVNALTNVSPFLENVLSQISDKHGDESRPARTFNGIDEVAMCLFQHWLANGRLGGPTDFTSLQYYLDLYVLALQFEIEQLQNEGIQPSKCPLLSSPF